MGARHSRVLAVAALHLAPAAALHLAPVRSQILLQPRVAVARHVAAAMHSNAGKVTSATPRKTNLYGMRDAELKAFLVEAGEKKFRLKQIKDFIYGEHPAEAIEEMHTLPKKLRQRLSEQTTLGSMEIAHEQVSSDGTRKRLWRCHDGSLIEAVLMPYATQRRTACISSQVGCAMGCTFCATGQMGFSRDLSEDEIFEQAARFSSELRAKGERLSNFVFMGMGEPFRNYDNVIGAARRIMSDLGIGARHITISTVGVVPNIIRFADECKANDLQISLAISLHESDDAKRSAIMPVNRKHKIDELLDACKYYVDSTGRRISFEWALIAGQNDDAVSALDLAERLTARGLQGAAKVRAGALVLLTLHTRYMCSTRYVLCRMWAPLNRPHALGCARRVPTAWSRMTPLRPPPSLGDAVSLQPHTALVPRCSATSTSYRSTRPRGSTVSRRACRAPRSLSVLSRSTASPRRCACGAGSTLTRAVGSWRRRRVRRWRQNGSRRSSFDNRARKSSGRPARAMRRRGGSSCCLRRAAASVLMRTSCARGSGRG